LKGLFYFARGWERFFVHAEGQHALHTSNEYFQRAISIDPQYAQAYAGLARSYLWLSDVDGPKAEAGAKAAADMAISLNETLAEPHMVRGFLLLDGDPDWAGAEREFLRSIELNPSYAEAHHGYAIYLSSLGRFDEATMETDRAVTLDPFSRAPKSQAAWIDVCAGRYDRGIVRLQNIVELYPDDALGHLGLGTAYVLRGRSQEGIAELKKSAVLGGQDQGHDRSLGWAYGMAGEKEHAMVILNELKRSSRQEIQANYCVAIVYAGLGDRDQVFIWLEKAYAARHDVLNDLWREPALIPLRADPRFRTLLHKAGLAA
jgi:tetratricopeptide (TPR) repeat protein